MPRMTTPWCAEEIALLKDMYGRVCLKDIQCLLERSRASVDNMRHLLGLFGPRTYVAGGWTDAEQAFLVRNYRVLTNQQIADQLGKLRLVVRTKIKALRLSGQSGAPPKWTEAEETYLLVAWQTDSAKDIAAALGRTVPAVRLRARSELKVRRPWSYYASLGQDWRLLPPEARELLRLNQLLKKRLRDEEHRRSAGATL